MTGERETRPLTSAPGRLVDLLRTSPSVSRDVPPAFSGLDASGIGPADF